MTETSTHGSLTPLNATSISRRPAPNSTSSVTSIITSHIIAPFPTSQLIMNSSSEPPLSPPGHIQDRSMPLAAKLWLGGGLLFGVLAIFACAFLVSRLYRRRKRSRRRRSHLPSKAPYTSQPHQIHHKARGAHFVVSPTLSVYSAETANTAPILTAKTVKLMRRWTTGNKATPLQVPVSPYCDRSPGPDTDGVFGHRSLELQASPGIRRSELYGETDIVSPKEQTVRVPYDANDYP